MDVINAQAVSKGFGVGRYRKVRRRALGYDARPGGSVDQRIPVLVPRDVRKIYLDDNATAVLHEGETLGPNIMQEQPMNWADLSATAAEGGENPKDENGGYILSEIKKLSGVKDGKLLLVEMEGDLVVDSSTSTAHHQGRSCHHRRWYKTRDKVKGKRWLCSLSGGRRILVVHRPQLPH